MTTLIACPYCGAKAGSSCVGYGINEVGIHEARRIGSTKASDVTELGRARALLGCSSSMSLLDGVRQASARLTEQASEIERIRSHRDELVAACEMLIADIDYGAAEVVGQTVEAIEAALEKAKGDE